MERTTAMLSEVTAGSGEEALGTIAAVVDRCLAADPANRPSASEAGELQRAHAMLDPGRKFGKILSPLLSHEGISPSTQAPRSAWPFRRIREEDRACSSSQPVGRRPAQALRTTAPLGALHRLLRDWCRRMISVHGAAGK